MATDDRQILDALHDQWDSDPVGFIECLEVVKVKKDPIDGTLTVTLEIDMDDPEPEPDEEEGE